MPVNGYLNSSNQYFGNNYGNNNSSPGGNRGVMLKGRFVSSMEEARASSIDFDGSTFYFPDIANNKIYTKQINADGTATFLMYEPKAIPQFNNNSYITREEFETALEQLKASLMPIEEKPKVQQSSVPQF